MNKQKEFAGVVAIIVVIVAIIVGGAYVVMRQEAQAPESNVASPITVLSPNGGEVWKVGTHQTIRWSAPTSIKLVNITLDTADHAFAPIPPCPNCGAPFFPLTLTKTFWSPNTGSFDWLVPTLRDNRYLIKVQAPDSEEISDISDQPFTVTSSTTTQ